MAKLKRAPIKSLFPTQLTVGMLEVEVKRSRLVKLSPEEREAFLEDYRVRVAAAYPRRKSGVTLYPFQRLFCVARL